MDNPAKHRVRLDAHIQHSHNTFLVSHFAPMQSVRQFRADQLRRVQPALLNASKSRPGKKLPAVKTGAAISTDAPAVPNPFLPHKNPETGRWAPPRYSLRQQADLVKRARKEGTLSLIPFGPKHTSPAVEAASSPVKSPILSLVQQAPGGVKAGEEWARPIQWTGNLPFKRVKIERKGVLPAPKVGGDGPAVKWLYSGRKKMFKGHAWEREKSDIEARRNMLLRDMDKRINRFKGTYKRKKPNPLKPPRGMAKAPKLPF